MFCLKEQQIWYYNKFEISASKSVDCAPPDFLRTFELVILTVTFKTQSTLKISEFDQKDLTVKSNRESLGSDTKSYFKAKRFRFGTRCSLVPNLSTISAVRIDVKMTDFRGQLIWQDDTSERPTHSPCPLIFQWMTMVFIQWYLSMNPSSYCSTQLVYNHHLSLINMF